MYFWALVGLIPPPICKPPGYALRAASAASSFPGPSMITCPPGRLCCLYSSCRETGRNFRGGPAPAQHHHVRRHNIFSYLNIAIARACRGNCHYIKTSCLGVGGHRVLCRALARHKVLFGGLSVNERRTHNLDRVHIGAKSGSMREGHTGPRGRGKELDACSSRRVDVHPGSPFAQPTGAS